MVDELPEHLELSAIREANRMLIERDAEFTTKIAALEARLVALTEASRRVSINLARTKQELKEEKEEFNNSSDLVRRQADLLRGVVGALRGPPPEDTLWSHHDAVELAQAAVENLRAARQAHDELVERLAERNEIIREWQPFPTIVVRELAIRIAIATDILREFLKADFANPQSPELWARVEEWLADPRVGQHNVPVAHSKSEQRRFEHQGVAHAPFVDPKKKEGG